MDNVNPVNKVSYSANRQCYGFTLIEVMVAVFVLLIGILGVVGMQSISLRESQNTYFRTQADMLISDILDRMRANRDAAQGAASAYAYDSSNDGAIEKPACDVAAADCSSAQMADYDLSQWIDSVTASSLPSPIFKVIRPGADSVYTIQIFWDEDRDGNVSEVCSGDQACIQATVQI